MTNVLVQCESMRETFRHWHAEQESLEAQLAESLSALSAYQSHLDGWQRQLADERDELRKTREQWERDGGAAGSELAQARAKEKELTAALEEQKQILENERAQWAQELDQLRQSASPPQAASETAAAPGRKAAQVGHSPVLGSLMEQFGKLSQQRAIERQALKKASR